MSSSSAFAMLHNKIRNAAEFRGLEPDQILRELHEDAERQLAREYDERQAAKYGVSTPGQESESFSQEIRMISRALAYRNATIEDTDQLEVLLNKAYKFEVEGNEAFRADSVPVARDSIVHYLTEPSYQWLVMEAPAGQTSEPEGTILGACCYSTDGHYKLKGQKLMQLGSIRYFAVLPRYHGFLIGQRLLAKVHDAFRKQGCQLSLVNIPSTRLSLIDWIQRRGYEPVNEVPYPFASLGHFPVQEVPENANAAVGKESEKVTLVQCLYALVDDATPPPPPSTTAATAESASAVSTTTNNTSTAATEERKNASFSATVAAQGTQTKGKPVMHADDDDSAQPKTTPVFTNNSRSSISSTNSSNNAGSSSNQQNRAARLADKVKRLTLDSGEMVHMDHLTSHPPAAVAATDSSDSSNSNEKNNNLQEVLDRVD